MLMYGSEGSHSGTLMYGCEGSHSGTLMYGSEGSHSGMLMYGSEGSHSSKTNVLLMPISICSCCKALLRNGSDFAKVRVCACHAHHSIQYIRL